MRIGQFWSIPLAGRYFARGRVLQFKELDGKPDSRIFLAGLLDWIGDGPPTAESISGVSLFAHGAAHVKTISANRGQILGCRDLGLDDITIPFTLSERSGSRLVQGFHVVGSATPQQPQTLPAFSTWGFRVILDLADGLLRNRTTAVR